MAVSQPPKVPPGNWIARQLKQMNDRSQGKVIPKTAASHRSYNKYSTVYDVQFSDMNEDLLVKFLKERECDAEERVKMEDARETVGDVFGVKRPKKPEEVKICSSIAPRSNKIGTLPTIQMFSNWKIPNRFSDDFDGGPLSKGDAICDDTGNIRASARRSVELKARQNTSPSPTRFPQLGHRRSKSTFTPRGGRLPTARESSVSPRRHTARKQNRSPVAQSCPQDLTNIFQPHAVYKADELLQNAPSEDRKAIQRVLRMAERKHQDDHAVKQSLQPNVQAPISNWLDGATEKDRTVALEFFKSLSGRKLVGSTGAEQSARLQDIIQALEGGKGSRSLTTPRPGQKSRSEELHPSLKHLRLLSPTSRKNRWMETTWHHLPEHTHTDPVNNWSSVYTKPHGFIPRHFTIHPEWG